MEKIKKNKRFVIVLAAALLLLGGAVWLNIKLNGNSAADVLGQDASPKPTETSKETMVNVYNDFFNSFRTERSEIRAQEIDYLRSIINSGKADKDTLADAQTRLMDLVAKMEKEFTIESQIRGKGFSDAAATYQGNSVTVVIDGDELTDEEVAKILDIVMTETGLPASAIKISLGA